MTDNFENKVAVDGPVVNEGELGSSTFSPGQVSPAGPLGLGQRWTVTRKREVARLLRGELLSRQLGVFRLELDASLKERKGDPVKAELDIEIMQVESGPLGRRRCCRHLSRHGFGLQQATAERPPAKRRGPKPSISDEALLVAIPLGGRGTPQGLGSASGLSWHPCFPQAGDAEQPALAPSPPPWRKSPCR